MEGGQAQQQQLQPEAGVAVGGGGRPLRRGRSCHPPPGSPLGAITRRALNSRASFCACSLSPRRRHCRIVSAADRPTKPSLHIRQDAGDGCCLASSWLYVQSESLPQPPSTTAQSHQQQHHLAQHLTCGCCSAAPAAAPVTSPAHAPMLPPTYGPAPVGGGRVGG